MRVRINQFTDLEKQKERLKKRFGRSGNLEPVLKFIDDARAAMARMEANNAHVHLKKEFSIDGKSITVEAGQTTGSLSSLWAKFFG